MVVHNVPLMGFQLRADQSPDEALTPDFQLVLHEGRAGEIVRANQALTETVEAIGAQLGVAYQATTDPATQAAITDAWQKAQRIADEQRQVLATKAALLKLAQDFKAQRDVLIQDIKSANYYANPLMSNLVEQIQMDYHEMMWEGLAEAIGDNLSISYEDADLLTDLLFIEPELADDFTPAQLTYFREGVAVLIEGVKALEGQEQP